MNGKFSRFAVTALALGLAMPAATPAGATSLLDYVGQCVPFARAASGIQIYGDAWTWWEKAAGKYARGYAPREGAVIVFARSPRLPLGHVAVISRVIDARVVMVTHANWSRIDGARGYVEQDVTLTDVSVGGDWSAVRVGYRGADGLGSSSYAIDGFIYGGRDSPELTARNPDYVGALIDVYAR